MPLGKFRWNFGGVFAYQIGMAGTTKRVATVVWSISIAVVLLVLTTSVMLPSTKRARISFDEDERVAATQPFVDRPSATTQPDFAISSSKSGVFRVTPTTPTTTTAERPGRIYGSKAAVFDLSKPAEPTTDMAPSESNPHISSSKSAVFEFPSPATKPSTAPSR